VTNTDSSPFEFQALLHSYLSVPKIEEVRVRGFENCFFSDKLSPPPPPRGPATDRRPLIAIGEEVDRIYSWGEGGKGSVELCLSGSNTPLLLCKSFAYRTVGGEGGRQPVNSDTVLWNAWIEKARAIADLDDDAYLHYVCVEPGLVSAFVKVAPLEAIVLVQELSLP
jgi:glucose-6-phosphate 1-epimerase